MCSSQGCDANSLPDSLIFDLHPWISRVQETVLASKAVGTIRTYLADFNRWKLWRLCQTVFATCLPIRFMLQPSHSA